MSQHTEALDMMSECYWKCIQMLHRIVPALSGFSPRVFICKMVTLMISLPQHRCLEEEQQQILLIPNGAQH